MNELFTSNDASLSDDMRLVYKTFCKEFLQRGGHKTHIVSPLVFVGFFIECDQRWQTIPSYEKIQATFDEAFIQQYSPVLRWLTTTGRMTVDDFTKDYLSMQGAVQEMLAKFGEDKPVSLQCYLDFLTQKCKAGSLSPKSLRSMMQPTLYLYHTLKIKGSHLPSQSQLDGYMKNNQGQASFIASFTKFLRETYHVDLVCKAKKKKPKIFSQKTLTEPYQWVDDTERKVFEKKFIQLAQLPKPLNDEAKLAWINTGIGYFHRIHVNIKDLSEVGLQYAMGYKLVGILYNGDKFALPRF